MVKCGGISRYSATTFTPPFETSVIVQSRGNDPAPHWIFAILLHNLRSLLRRSAYMSISPTAIGFVHRHNLAGKDLNQASKSVRNVAVVFLIHLPNAHANGGCVPRLLVSPARTQQALGNRRRAIEHDHDRMGWTAPNPDPAPYRPLGIARSLQNRRQPDALRGTGEASVTVTPVQSVASAIRDDLNPSRSWRHRAGPQRQGKTDRCRI
jgi:hypothetical protein